MGDGVSFMGELNLKLWVRGPQFKPVSDNMESRLQELLSETAVRGSTGDGYTHASLYGPSEYWNLKAGSYTDFWFRYSKLAAKNIRNLCMAERIPETLPVVADFVMRFREDGGHYEPYNGEFLKTLALLFQGVIGNMFY